MGALRCVDGSVLSVEAVSCRDRSRPAVRDHAESGQGLGAVRRRRPAMRVPAVRARRAHQRGAADPAQVAAWPDPDDRFPAPTATATAAGLDSRSGQLRRLRPGPGRGGHAAGYLPGDHEYFALRSRERVDLPGTGELRCVLRSSAVWVGECVGVGQHPRDRRAQPGNEPVAGQHAAPGQHGVPRPAQPADLAASPPAVTAGGS